MCCLTCWLTVKVRFAACFMILFRFVAVLWLTRDVACDSVIVLFALLCFECCACLFCLFLLVGLFYVGFAC